MLSPVSLSNSWRSAASWHRMQYLVHGTASRRFGLDVLFAMHANAVAAVRDARQRAAHVAQQVRFAVEVADGEFALAGQLHFVQRIRGFFDGDVFPVTETGGELSSAWLPASLCIC